MGKKDKSFVSKLGGNKKGSAITCQTCGEQFNLLQLIESEKSNSGTWKFKERFVGVCKCNQKEIYG